MKGESYLEGAIPYSEEVVKEYVENGTWLNLTYGDILDRSAEHYPDKVAVVDERNRLTYTELTEKVDRFAIALLELGVRQYDRILVQLPNRYEFVVAFYAVCKVGAVPVLAVPRHEYREVSSFVSLAEPVVWIVPIRDEKREFMPLVQRILSEFKSLKYPIMLEDGEALPPGTLSMGKLTNDVKLEDYPSNYLEQFYPDPNDVAALIPTGGTTGLPKMVPRTHNSLIATNKYISKDITSDDVVLQVTPVGHGMALQGGVNCAIFKGATLVLQRVLRPTEILQTIQRERITCVSMVPTQLEGIVNHPDLRNYDVRSLRIIGTTGAPTLLEIGRKAAEYFSQFGCAFKGNSLGASEGLLAIGELSDPLDVKLRTVGRNVTPGSHYKVVDSEETEFPTNTEGELVARGPETFTGYYKTTAQENKEAFTRDGYFRTGDLAKIDEHGYITITGRRKDVIIRGGETLVPSEMESLLRQHPDVSAVAVVGMPDPRMGERACAYVVPKPRKPFAFDEMTDFLKSRGAGVLLLPERLEVVDSLPQTAIGKIDKKALRKDIEGKLKREEN